MLAVKPEYLWLLSNGNNAEKHAVNLLNGNNIKTPTWAIDLTVIQENGLILFNKPNSDNIYAFSPKNIPSKKGLSWSHMWGSWYVAKN